MPPEPEKRAVILAAVWSVIADRGIAALSFRHVAAAAGVSVGLVQHYFGSKDNLVRASAATMIDGSALRFAEPPADPRAELRRLIAHSVPATPGSRRGVGVWYAYIAASVADPELAALLRAAKRGQERSAAELIAAAAPGIEAGSAARRLVALADGLTARVVTGDLEPAEAVAAIDAALADLG
ncbi:TetR/AcrR family transcriptional regulator [Nocardia sp. NPDC057353]|uniref:TetR/AcrR family transcriptional regulator n=1 Tax=Nocardia sp. NPDC057353 TaxID=3346104 RepID=UPI003644534C